MAYYLRAGSRLVSSTLLALGGTIGLLTLVHSCPVKEQCYLDVFDTEFVPPPPEEPTPYEEEESDFFRKYDFEDGDAEEDPFGKGFSKENASQEDASQDYPSQEDPSQEDAVHRDDDNLIKGGPEDF